MSSPTTGDARRDPARWRPRDPLGPRRVASYGTFNQNETKTDANLLFGTARANFLVIPYTSPLWLGLNAGGSLVKRGGKAYEAEADKTDIGGVIGATVGLNLGGMLSFYVAAEDYIYGRTFVDASSLEEKRTQNEVQLAVGFGVPLQQ